MQGPEITDGLLQGFAPVINRNAHRLILGSFPSEASLAAGQYYAHPRNQFWRLVGDLIGEPLAALPYGERLKIVLLHRVGIWDVLHACERQGSGDAAIRNSQANAFTRLRQLAPSLASVAFNGQTAGRVAATFAAGGFHVAVLPSSSPAHAGRTYEQKLQIWKAWWDASEPRRGGFPPRDGPRRG